MLSRGCSQQTIHRETEEVTASTHHIVQCMQHAAGDGGLGGCCRGGAPPSRHHGILWNLPELPKHVSHLFTFQVVRGCGMGELAEFKQEVEWVGAARGGHAALAPHRN